jgi:multiple sugar transport system ATP-binding protein
MKDGRILQVDAPQALYERPRDLFVAGFIGSPAMNLVDATLDGSEVIFGQFRVPLDWSRRPAERSSGRVIVGIRPEAFEDAAFAPAGLPTMEVEVVVLEELGADAHVFFRVEATRIATGEPEEGEDEGVELVGQDSGALLNARVDARTTARVGESLRLAVDPARFHFFDPDSSLSLLHAAPAEAQQAVSPVA